jgi:hypothetical protein
MHYGRSGSWLLCNRGQTSAGAGRRVCWEPPDECSCRPTERRAIHGPWLRRMHTRVTGTPGVSSRAWRTRKSSPSRAHSARSERPDCVSSVTHEGVLRKLSCIAMLTFLVSACGTSATIPVAPSYATLTVVPQIVQLSVNQQQCFTASGGSNSFVWMLTMDDGGQGVFSAHGAQACFQSPVFTEFKISAQSTDGQTAIVSGIVLP